MNLSEWASLARQLREAQEDLQGTLLLLTRHVEGSWDGTNPMQVQSEGTLAMDVDDLKRKAARLQESLEEERTVIDTLTHLREGAN